MSEPLRVILVGAGAIAAVHADAYRMFPNECRIVAVCDPFAEKAEGLIRDKKLDAKAYADYHKAFAECGAQAVSICVPPALHTQTAIDALDAGLHVLCEKPMANSLEECDAMIAAARRSGRLLSIVAQNRFKTPNQKVKTLLAQGAAGRPLFVTVNSLWWRGQNYYDLWWRGTWERESGGCVANHAVHHIDLLLWMMGMPRRVTAVLANVGHDNSQCEDVGTAVLEYPKALAQLTASLVTHDEEQEMIFQCERGRLSVPWKPAASKALPNGFPQPDADACAALQKAYDALPALALEGHPAQIHNFLSAVRGTQPLAVDGAQGRAAIELIGAIYKAACTHAPVELPFEPDDPFAKKGGIAANMPHFHEKVRSVDNFEKSPPITLGRNVGQ